MARKSKKKNQEARRRHQVAKRRARVKRVLDKYGGDRYWCDYIGGEEDFPKMLAELCQLNLKYLQQYLSDLESQKPAWDPEARKRQEQIKIAVQSAILERTLLK